MGVFCIGGREGRCVFRRLCVGMILGWDFYWFGVGRGCDVFGRGGRVRKGRSWGRVDVLVCYGCVAKPCTTSNHLRREVRRFHTAQETVPRL